MKISIRLICKDKTLAIITSVIENIILNRKFPKIYSSNNSNIILIFFIYIPLSSKYSKTSRILLLDTVTVSLLSNFISIVPILPTLKLCT